jgi:hypothetical protein
MSRVGERFECLRLRVTTHRTGHPGCAAWRDGGRQPWPCRERTARDDGHPATTATTSVGCAAADSCARRPPARRPAVGLSRRPPERWGGRLAPHPGAFGLFPRPARQRARGWSLLRPRAPRARGSGVHQRGPGSRDTAHPRPTSPTIPATSCFAGSSGVPTIIDRSCLGGHRERSRGASFPGRAVIIDQRADPLTSANRTSCRWTSAGGSTMPTGSPSCR